jgi:hypothetical protein
VLNTHTIARRHLALAASGVALSEFVLDGTPHSLKADFSAADPSRVFPGLCSDAAWVENRAAEGPKYPTVVLPCKQVCVCGAAM